MLMVISQLECIRHSEGLCFAHRSRCNQLEYWEGVLLSYMPLAFVGYFAQLIIFGSRTLRRWLLACCAKYCFCIYMLITFLNCLVPTHDSIMKFTNSTSNLLEVAVKSFNFRFSASLLTG